LPVPNADLRRRLHNDFEKTGPSSPLEDTEAPLHHRPELQYMLDLPVGEVPAVLDKEEAAVRADSGCCRC